MWGRGSCIRISGIEFAAEKPVKGVWVSRHDPKTGETRFIPLHELPAAPEVHAVQQDTMDPIMSHVDCKMYDSKSALLESYKRQGYRVVEKGERGSGWAKTKTSVRESLREQIQALSTPSYREQFEQRKRWMRENGREE